MPFTVRVIEGPDKDKVFTLFDDSTLLLGRSRHTDSKFNDPHISRVHCEIELRKKLVTVNDLDSNSGTFLNGKRVNEAALRVGDIVRIGDTQLRLESGAVTDQDTLPPTDKPVLLPAERLGELAGRKLSHYQVGPMIAKAHSGMLFKAVDFKSDRVVALKVLWPEFSKNDDEMQRFVRAMKTMLPHRHPNLVALYGAGKTGPYCWIAMEYVEGESLTQVIQRIGTAGMLDWRYSLRVGLHIAAALEYAHGRSIIHRNITPQNIMVTSSEDKTAKLGDLMLAKAQEGTLAQQITKPGEILGDIRYMSPERTTGTGVIDGRADIYSLGATIYALLTGRPPCEGVSLVEIIQKIRNVEPVKPKKYQLAIPDLFEGVVMRMLAKSPDQRHANATDLVRDLERVAKFQGVKI